jgi:superfamily II DNA or RNA helicase
MGFKLRPYQRECCKAIQDAWHDHQSVMVELATGTGKTEIFTEMLRRLQLSEQEKSRGLVVCPQLPLIAQAADKIYKRTGDRPAIEQASNWSREHGKWRSDFIVGSKQSLTLTRRDGTKRYERFEDVGVLIVDECHLSITPPFIEMVEHFLRGGAKVLGVTATAKRHDGKAEGVLYETCAFQYGIQEAIKDGWLVAPKTEVVMLKSLDLSNIGTSYNQYGADFAVTELNEAIENLETICEIADAAARETKGRKTVVYCASVAEAKLVSERLSDHHGIKSGWICADEKRCTKKTREATLASFVSDDEDSISHVANVGILTTGWDFPALQAIVMARPTKSKPLFTQILGRGTRALEGVVDFPDSTPELRRQRIAESAKPDFLMIDLVDNSLEHKIVTSADVLGGNYNVAVVDRAKGDLLAAEGPQSVSDALERAERELAAEEVEIQREKRERAERRARAKVKAQLEYEKRQVDVFGQVEGISRSRGKSKATMPFGKYKGRSLSEVPTGYLQYALANFTLHFTTELNVQDELVRRMNPAPRAEPSASFAVKSMETDLDDVLQTLRRK